MFVFVGRLWRGKGLDELLTAYRNLEAEVGDKISLLIIGDGVDERHYRRLFEPLPRVVMPGFVQPAELPGWYALADCLVFPTHGDPNGLVVEEALAAGLPVIVSDAAGDIAAAYRRASRDTCSRSAQPVTSKSGWTGSLSRLRFAPPPN